VAAQSNKLWPKNNSYQSQEFNRSGSVVRNLVYIYKSQLTEQNILSVVKTLIDRYWFETSIQIDHEDEEGRTPLHLAVMTNRHSFVSYLLENGARLDVRHFFLFFSD